MKYPRFIHTAPPRQHKGKGQGNILIYPGEVKYRADLPWSKTTWWIHFPTEYAAKLALKVVWDKGDFQRTTDPS